MSDLDGRVALVTGAPTSASSERPLSLTTGA
jgi:hypothetical protein